MGGIVGFPLQILLVTALAVFGVYLLVKLLMLVGWLLGRLFEGVGNVFARLGNFIGGEVSDSLRLIGGVVTAALFVPLTVANIALGRWSRANHYGKALEEEAVGVAKCVYRMGLGHPARLLGVTHLTDGVERRLPEAIRRAPGVDLPRGRPDAFDGYTVTGALPAGGSGARLYLAEPSAAKRTALEAQGHALPGKVVIKSFSLGDGSTLPQIVRESRALHSARKLGLVLEHELTSSRFHYVMPYVPGDDLTLVTQRLHAASPAAGLGDAQLREMLGYTADLLEILERFHAEGLWHKDIKPSNIIVSDGRVKLVDLGLITPLQSAMTLTTHGTEYFRDPELVRLALKGVKVHEVDGVKFDIYGAGAVLYSMIENSFPAHGSLSQITKRCPESVRWIIRRAMADMAKRYGSAREMLADLRTVMAARDPSKVPPAALPSMGGTAPEQEPLAWAAQGASDAPGAGAAAHGKRRDRTDRGLTAASKRSGGVRVGAVAAAVIVLGMLSFGALMFTPLLEHDMSAAFRPSASVTQHYGLTHQEDMPRPLAGHDGDVIIDGHHPSLATPAPLPAPPAPHARSSAAGSAALAELRSVAGTLGGHRSSKHHHQVLVIDDSPVGLRDLSERVMERTVEGLRLAHFEVIGWRDLPHDLDDEEHARLEAAARAKIGVGDPGDMEVAKRLRKFLAHEKQVDALLWLGRGADGDTLRLEFLAASDEDQGDGDRVLSLAARAL